MEFDRFDIFEAYHLWFTHYYSGFDSNYIGGAEWKVNLNFLLVSLIVMRVLQRMVNIFMIN